MIPLHGSEHCQGEGACVTPWSYEPCDVWLLKQLSIHTQNEAKQRLTILSREHTGHSKHPLPTTKEATLHMDITRWSIPKSDSLYFVQPKLEKVYTDSKCSNHELLTVTSRLKLKKHVDGHTLLMWQIMHWSRGWSCTDTVTEHGLITWLSCSDHVT